MFILAKMVSINEMTRVKMIDEELVLTINYEIVNLTGITGGGTSEGNVTRGY